MIDWGNGSDFIIYNIESDFAFELAKDTSKIGGPGPGFTLRTTIDPLNEELFVLSGREHISGSNCESVRNSLWSYSIPLKKWHCIYQNDNEDAAYWEEMRTIEPCPRFAHQLVIDHQNKVHYLFGGNPGESSNPYLRLDDFWSLKLTRSSTDDILTEIKFLIRKQKYLELCASSNHLEALAFLQSKLSEVTNHQEQTSSGQFRKLASALCQPDASRMFSFLFLPFFMGKTHPSCVVNFFLGELRSFRGHV